MPAAPHAAYLVAVKDGDPGEIVTLTPGTKFSFGRAPENRVILRDDLISRDHAEFFYEAGWVVRDLKSRNGSFVNEHRVTVDQVLDDGDEVRFGRNRYRFQTAPPAPKVEPTEQMPAVAIMSRLERSKFVDSSDQTVNLPPPSSESPAYAAVGKLYQLGLDIAAAKTPTDLADIVAAGLLLATAADVVAVLAPKENREWEPVAYRTRSAGAAGYQKVSQFVTTEVLATRQAVLAENVAADAKLSARESLKDLRATALICAPAECDGHLHGLLHLYATRPETKLTEDDLELTLAAARQFAAAWQRLKREAALAAEAAAWQARYRADRDLIGDSPPMADLRRQIGRVAKSKATVLVRGESGTGKELVARAVHAAGPRRDGPFVVLNCTALHDATLDVELFGAPTAHGRAVGKLAAADQGTLFLDEVADLSPAAQATLLRAVEELAGDQPRADVRVVAATHRNLETMVAGGAFRRDLFFRLQVVQLDAPPLRDHAADVPVLADYFLERAGKASGRRLHGFTPAAMAKLAAHRWPGNVRELRNTVERAVALAVGTSVEATDVWLSGVDGVVAFEPVTLFEAGRRHVRAMLKYTGGEKERAAELLGITPADLDAYPK